MCFLLTAGIYIQINTVKNSGTVDVDFALTFTVNGTTEDLQNIINEMQEIIDGDE